MPNAIAPLAAVRAGLSSRPEGDFYPTPPACTRALLEADAIPCGAVWEPACGDGAISEVLRAAGYAVASTDLYDRRYGRQEMPLRDFLAAERLPVAGCAVVTNPPFAHADAFVRHALDLGAPYVAMFQRLAWLEGGARHTALWGPRPPSRVWVFSNRQTLWRGDDAEARSSGGAMAFAWYVWDVAAPPGPPVLGWLQTPRTKGQRARGANALALSLM